VVLPEGWLLVCLVISLRRLVGLLRQHRDDEFLNCVVSAIDVLHFDFRRYLRCSVIPGLEAQSLHIPDAIC